MSDNNSSLSARAALPAIVVMVSGNGTNLQALLDASQSGALPCSIMLIVSSSAKAGALARAERAGVPSVVCSRAAFRAHGNNSQATGSGELDRKAYDSYLARVICDHSARVGVPVAAVVLAGWMHVLGPAFLDVFPGRVVNLHPALPGAFDGMHAIQRAHSAACEAPNGRLVTGVMVHIVTPVVDHGRVLVTRNVEARAEEPLDEFEARMHNAEHEAIVEGVRMLLHEQREQQ